MFPTLTPFSTSNHCPKRRQFYKYRFAFNGQERDDEVAGVGNIMTAEFWEYDTRLGRRWNLDRVVYAWQSLYACFNNNPIFYSDPNGDEPTPDGKPIDNKTPTPWKVGSENSSLSIPLKEFVISAPRQGPSLKSSLVNAWNITKNLFISAGQYLDGLINFGIQIVGQVCGDINYARKPKPGMTIKTIDGEQMEVLGTSRKDLGVPFSWGKEKTPSLTDQRNQPDKPQAPNSGPLDGMGAPDQEQVEQIAKERSDSIHNPRNEIRTKYYFPSTTSGKSKPDSIVDFDEHGKRIGKRPIN